MADGSSAAYAPRATTKIPTWLSRPVLLCLDRTAARLIRLGVTANAITTLAAAVAALAGLLLSLGCFGWASLAMSIACLGDALDGPVARRSGMATIGGALLDASVDRYGEFFFLAGLAVYFRASLPVLLLALFALAGSFMVSYGSAKAEGLRVPVPPSAMRRAERAVCLCTGVALVAPFAALARLSLAPLWAANAPIVVALTLIAVVANVSAIRRLRALAAGAAQVRVGSSRGVPAPSNKASAAAAQKAGASRSASPSASCLG
jgi:CDP-diacylglycerol--glycerol-3-phosphate 3-phosphatidyltransferase